MFHMLRRQMVRAYRRPLIVMSPKSLLRHRLSVSGLEDLAQAGFQVVIDEIDALDPAAVRHVLLCSGKVYFDLLEERRDAGHNDTAIVRVEQIYPFPDQELSALLARYTRASVVRWVQEEPWNQGAWFYMHPNLKPSLLAQHTLDCVSRPPSASPAVGYLHRHIEQQRTLLREAFEFDHVRGRKRQSV
jgi:2-oxoglutarate dehydrogenase E1 component